MVFQTIQQADDLILQVLERRNAHYKTAQNIKRQLGSFHPIQNLVERDNPYIDVNDAVMEGYLTHIGKKRLFNGTLLLKGHNSFLESNLRAF